MLASSMWQIFAKFVSSSQFKKVTGQAGKAQQFPDKENSLFKVKSVYCLGLPFAICFIGQS